MPLEIQVSRVTLEFVFRLRAFGVVLGICSVVASTYAQAAATTIGIPVEIEAAIHRAAEMPGPDYLTMTVIAATSERPDLVSNIIMLVAHHAPHRANVVARETSAAFPGFAPEIAAAIASDSPVPTDTTKPEEPEIHTWRWSGELDIVGSRNTGNTDDESIDIAAKITGRFGRWQQDFSLGFDFNREDNETSEQRFIGDTRTRYNFDDRLYGLVILEYEDDRFSDFRFRLVEAIALGYLLIDRKSFTFSFEAGPGSRQSKRDDTGDTEVEFIGAARGILNWQVSDTTKFSNDTKFFWGTESITTRNLTSVTTKIIEALAMRLSYEVRHDDSPPPEDKSTDTTSKISLVYEFCSCHSGDAIT